MVALFLNGEGMRGGAVHHNIAPFPFLGEVRTAPRYRFYCLREEFPGLAPAPPGAAGVEVLGELYDVPLAVIGEDFLPEEPPELELGVVLLNDGRHVLGVQLRPGEAGSGRHLDISETASWRAHRERTV